MYLEAVRVSCTGVVVNKIHFPNFVSRLPPVGGNKSLERKRLIPELSHHGHESNDRLPALLALGRVYTLCSI